MPKKTKAAKTTKKGRTKIKNLPVNEKELSAAERKKVKAGITGALAGTAASPVYTLTSPADKNIVLDSELGIKKFLGGV